MSIRSRFVSPLALASLALALQADEAEVQKLTPGDASPGNLFGRSVDLDGNVLVAGAPGTGPSGADAGAAYVFSTRTNGRRFLQRARLAASDGRTGDAFGFAVALDDNTLVVGAPRWDGFGQDSGAAYVFVNTGERWVEVQRLAPSLAAAGDGFGTSVALLGGTILVGAPRGGPNATLGSAFVFVRSGEGWIQEAELSAFDASPGNQFGASVALSDDLALVGASLQDGYQMRSGAAYAFERSGGSWSLDQKLEVLDGATNDLFGVSVALMGQRVLVVGAPGADLGGVDAGAAYRFGRGKGSWRERQRRIGQNPGDRLGGTVDLAFNFSVMGCKSYAAGGNANAGGAALWELAKAPLSNMLVASDASTGAQLGNSVSAGACWFAAGAFGDAQNGKNAGAVYVYVPLEGSTSIVNGNGTNPLLLSTTEGPNIGTPWRIEIDASAYPGVGMSELRVYRRFAPAPMLRGAGEILVDMHSQRIATSRLRTAGTTVHTVLLPPDPFLIGMQVAVQGMLRKAESGVIHVYTNGELATFGCKVTGDDR